MSFIETHAAEKIRDINDNVSYFSISVLALSTLFAEMIMFAGLLIFLAFMNVKITLFTFSIIVLILISYFLFFKRKIDRWSKETNIKAVQKMKNLTEPFSSYKEILIYNAKNFSEKIQKSNIRTSNTK